MIRLPAALSATLLAAALALPAAAQQIGTVASSEPTLRGTPPGAPTRTLAIGTGVVADETIASSASGRGQLLFLDQTTLTLAPNTTITLDRFVFDPNSGNGSFGLNLAQGALRFIGGTLSRETEATVTTPAATIGIRGSTGIVVHLNGETIAIFIAGDRMCITTGGRQSCTSRQGGVLTPDGYAGRVNPAYLAQILALLDGPPATGGGAAPGSGTGDGDGNGTPVSTGGAQFDLEIFDDDLTVDDLINALGAGDDTSSPGVICDPYDPTSACYGGVTVTRP